MSTIGIVFLIIAVVFFVLGTFMYIVQKIITNRIYHEENEEVKEEKPKKKIAKLNTPEDIDTSLLDEIDNAEDEEL